MKKKLPMKSIPDVEEFIGKAQIIGIAIADHSVSVASKMSPAGEWKSGQLPPPSRVRIAWLHARRLIGCLLVRAGEAIR